MTTGTVHRFTSARGYTLIELVTVIILISVVAAMALPRFVGSDVFVERGFFDEAQTALRYAHSLSTTSGCDVRVEFGMSGYSIAQWADCHPSDHSATAAAVSRPGGGDFTGSSPAGVGVSSCLFYFDRLGRPRQVQTGALPALITGDADLQITVGTRTLQVEPDTGATHEL